jgi:hypothetical protein
MKKGFNTRIYQSFDITNEDVDHQRDCQSRHMKRLYRWENMEKQLDRIDSLHSATNSKKRAAEKMSKWDRQI